MAELHGTFVGEVEGGMGRLWLFDETGVRHSVPHVIKDSPVGLSWGYEGNGPADTARSILAVQTASTEAAERYQAAFTAEVVAKLPLDDRFALPQREVRSWLGSKGYERPALERQRRVAPLPPVDDGQDQVEHLDARAAQLSARARALDERERRMAEREARVDALAVTVGLVPEVTPATWLAAEPVRHQLQALVVDTGDDIEGVARAIGIDPAWAAAVVDAKTTRVDLPHVRQVCAGLRCTPYDLWGTAGARSVAYAYGPSQWPADTEALVAADGIAASPEAELSVATPGPWPPPGGPVGPELAPELAPELVP